MLLTHKIQLKLNNEQESLLNKISDEARKMYNHYLSEKLDYYDINKKNLSYFTQQKDLKNYQSNYLTYDIKKEILRNLDQNFKSFFKLVKTRKDLNPKPPKFRSYKYFFTLSFVQDFIIKDNQLIISYLKHKRLKINLDYMLPIQGMLCERHKDESQIKQLKIYKKDNNNYFASIVYEKKEGINQNNKYVSIDLGKKNLVTIYDIDNKEGIIYNSKLYDQNQKYYDKRIDELKSIRDVKTKYSIKWNKLNDKVRYLYSKKRNQSKLIFHKLSKDLTNSNIIIGDLTNLKQDIKSDYDKKLNRQMQNNWPIITFVSLLEYKQQLKGNKLIKVNEAWTSKTCSKCGSINHGLTLDDRTYNCEDCGLEIDRDLNGAMNIMKVFTGDYNTPLEINKISERFSWCHTKKMNRIEEVYN